MPLPPITLTRAEPVRLVSPRDDAIDFEATGPEAMREYVSLDGLDVSLLTFKPNMEPTWFEARALGPRELRAVRAQMPAPDPEVHEPCAAAAAVRAEVLEEARKQAEGAGEEFDPESVGLPPEAFAPQHATRALAGWNLEAFTLYLQYGLVRIENLEGWGQVERERYQGLRRWPAHAIAALPDDVLNWLGSIVSHLTTLSEKKS